MSFFQKLRSSFFLFGKTTDVARLAKLYVVPEQVRGGPWHDIKTRVQTLLIEAELIQIRNSHPESLKGQRHE